MGLYRGDNLGALARGGRTRLVEPDLTSPMAKTPARLVSSGWRSPGPAAGPVRTKPLGSTSTRDPMSHLAFASAPMKQKSWLVGRRRLGAVPRSPAHRLQDAVVALQRSQLRMRDHFDVGQGADAVDQIAGHARFERGAANQHRQAPGVGRQEDGGLAGRIPASDHHHVGALTEPRLDRRGPIVHCGRFELVDARDGEPAIVGAAGDDDGPCPDDLPTRQPQLLGLAVLSPRQPNHLLGDRDLDPEFLRLVVAPAISAMPLTPAGKPR